MVLSRVQSAGAYEHIITNVFGLGQDAPLRLALKEEGITNISDFLSLAAPDIEALTFPETDPEGNTTYKDVPKGHKRLITVFLILSSIRLSKKNPLETLGLQLQERSLMNSEPALII